MWSLLFHRYYFTYTFFFHLLNYVVVVKFTLIVRLAANQNMQGSLLSRNINILIEPVCLSAFSIFPLFLQQSDFYDFTQKIYKFKMDLKDVKLQF